jgi:hypothetical protein
LKEPDIPTCWRLGEQVDWSEIPRWRPVTCMVADKLLFVKKNLGTSQGQKDPVKCVDSRLLSESNRDSRASSRNLKAFAKQSATPRLFSESNHHVFTFRSARRYYALDYRYSFSTCKLLPTSNSRSLHEKRSQEYKMRRFISFGGYHAMESNRC